METSLREASIKLEYLAILNLLDETYKDSEHIDVLIQFTEQMAKSSIQELKQVPKQIGNLIERLVEGFH